MRPALPRALRNWGDEIGSLLRRWWWIAALVLVLSWLPPVPAVQVAFTVGCVAVAALLCLGCDHGASDASTAR